ncbi:MAG: hypothetical protein JSS04_13080 [Proteobacteria bacterium]|nr:hypothetical protein [Pseudomonadota bacterium]
MPFDGKNRTASPLTHMLADGRQQLDRGWCQHRSRQRGSVCMIGSLPIRDYDMFVAAERLLLEAILDLGHAQTSIVDFNDSPARTKQQVLQVYDRAIQQSLMVA